MVEGKPDNNKDQPEAQGAEGVNLPEVRETEFIEESELTGRDVDEAGKPAAPAAEVAAESAAEQLADPVPPAARDASAAREAPPRSSPLLPLLSGAVGAAIVVGAAWFTVGQNLNPTAPQQTDTAALTALTALAARVASAESKADAAAAAAANVAAPPAASAPAPPPAGDTAAPDPAIAQRIDALEKSIAGLKDELSTANEKAAQLSAAVNALKLAPPAGEGAAAEPGTAAAPAVDLSEVNAKLAQLDGALKALPPPPAPADLTPINEHLAKLDAAVAKPPSFDDSSLRRVVASMLLDRAVRSGEAYAPLLTLTQPLAKESDELKALETFAATGIPSASVLCRELIALMPKLIPGYDPLDSTASITERLKAGAIRLNRFQTSESGGSRDRNLVLARMAEAAHRNDLAEAQRELSSLDPSERGAAQAWLDRANARDAALAASQKFAAAALATLPKTSP
jgi:hypothetical protein